MSDGEIWRLLERVGLTRGGAERPMVGALDTLRDPAATDQLAQVLAERLSAERPDIVVVWEGLHTAILGYAVGVRLGAPVVILSDDEGLVTASAQIRAAARAVFVAPTTPDAAIRRMARGYLDSRGASQIATATLLATAAAGGTIALAELPPESEEASQLSQMRGDQRGR